MTSQTPSVTDALERLAALAEKATSGPWRGIPHSWEERGIPILADSGDVAVTMSKTSLDQRITDAAFIAASRNALPALIAVARAAKALVAYDLDAKGRVYTIRSSEPDFDALRESLRALETEL